MVEWLYESNLIVLYAGTTFLFAAAAAIGTWIGQRFLGAANEGSDIGTLAGAALGLLALLLAFSFSLAMSRFDARRSLVLEEANAIGSTANFALMLPESARKPILNMLHDYVVVRIGLGVPSDPSNLQRDVARSLDLQARLWQQAVVLTAEAPQSLPVYRFVASLNEMNNIHESRLWALRYRVPGPVLLLLIAVASVAMGLTGYHCGVAGSQRPVTLLIMSLTLATVITMIFDLDRPARGLIEVPVGALVDAAQAIPR